MLRSITMFVANFLSSDGKVCSVFWSIKAFSPLQGLLMTLILSSCFYLPHGYLNTMRFISYFGLSFVHLCWSEVKMFELLVDRF